LTIDRRRRPRPLSPQAFGEVDSSYPSIRLFKMNESAYSLSCQRPHLTEFGETVKIGIIAAATGCALAWAVVSQLAISAANSVFHDQPAGPRSLPADNLPPFGMLDDAGHLIPIPTLPAGAALHGGPGSPPESTAPGPALDLAVEAARAALDACSKAGFRTGVTVVDSVGEARAMLTADGSDGSHVFVAMRKALTALMFKMPSSEASKRVANDPTLLGHVTPNMFVVGGGLPILRRGEVIGAIGVSGGGGEPIGHQDEVCAAAGLKYLEAKMR
jgi:uncharacterized protein GlcG (DUF336 family)